MSKGIHFEQSIEELEKIVRQLEKGELTLEDSLKQFEKGIGLARHCHDVLQQAEQKIETLTADRSTTQPTSPDEELRD
ncbi:exodeoxyribonuclease VII small subunit [Legionella sp.]|uniref:exodeoxyribonuclease VII small subunit n=1 Tax=Legionella sp. TaxID=459 RepID=UPI003CAD2B60